MTEFTDEQSYPGAAVPPVPGNPREDQGIAESITVLRYLAHHWSAMTPEQRDEAIREFFAEREMVLAGLARERCRRARLSPNRDLDDVHQIIQMEAWESFQQAMVDPDYLAGITVGWEYHVSRKAVNRINALGRSEEAGGMSGADRVLRRKRSLDAHRRQMVAENGVEPTDQELLDDYNRKIAETRAHPGKEGVATVADIQGPSLTSRDAVDSEDGEEERGDLIPSVEVDHRHPASDGATRLDPTDRLRMGAFVREHLVGTGTDEQTVKYAEWWLGQFDPDRGGTEMTVKEQSDLFGVSPYLVRKMQEATRRAIVTVLETKFGIAAPASDGGR